MLVHTALLPLTGCGDDGSETLMIVGGVVFVVLGIVGHAINAMEQSPEAKAKAQREEQERLAEWERTEQVRRERLRIEDPSAFAREEEERAKNAEFWREMQAILGDQLATASEAERFRAAEEAVRTINARRMICPHCGGRGGVRTQPVKVKTGISGTKATAAILTSGWSLLATGLSQKENMTQAWCNNCGARWRF